MEITLSIVFTVIGALLGVLFSVLLTSKLESVFTKAFNSKFGKKSDRNIKGYWITQYKFPSYKSKTPHIETQIVKFKQRKNLVTGHTIEADKHPEVFEGRITENRYFTGVYMNSGNHQNYHGAFQFILSNSKGQMEGLWIGFNDDSTFVNHGEWRWQQLTDAKSISSDELQKFKEQSRSINLFDGDWKM